MRKFLLLAVFFTHLFCEPSIFDMMDDKNTQKSNNLATKDENLSQNSPNRISLDDIKNIAPSDEMNLNVSDDEINKDKVALNFELQSLKMPKFVLQDQIFSFILQVKLENQSDMNIKGDIFSSQNVKILNDLKFSSSDGKIYTAILWAIIKDNKPNGLEIHLNLLKNAQLIKTATISPDLPVVRMLNSNANFNSIVADEFKVVQFKTSFFDDKNLIMLIEANVKNGDLSQFYIDSPKIIKQGTESIKGDFSNQFAFYFAIFEPNLKSLDFNYYNLKSAQFESFSLPVEIQNDDISTQIGLNPQESEFEFYKNALVYTFAIFFAILFIWRRKWLYIALCAVFVIYAFYSYKPFSNAVLKANSNVQILPTKNSSVFYIPAKNEVVRVLSQRDEFKKIMTNDGKIGWVRNENLAKN